MRLLTSERRILMLRRRMLCQWLQEHIGHSPVLRFDMIDYVVQRILQWLNMTHDSHTDRHVYFRTMPNYQYFWIKITIPTFYRSLKKAVGHKSVCGVLELQDAVFIISMQFGSQALAGASHAHVLEIWSGCSTHQSMHAVSKQYHKVRLPQETDVISYGNRYLFIYLFIYWIYQSTIRNSMK